LNTRTSKLLTIFMMIFMVSLSFSPVMAADNSTGLADSASPKYQQDNQNTGQSEYTGPQNNTTKWTYTPEGGLTGYGLSIGIDGTIYIPTVVDDVGVLLALNPNGTRKWNYTIQDGDGAYIRGAPSVAADGTIYFPTDRYNNGNLGKFYALNPDGTLKWNYTVNDAIHNWIAGSPLIADDGTIYITGYLETNPYYYGNVLALNPDGTLKWNYTVTDKNENFIDSSPALGHDGTIYFTNRFYNGTNYISSLFALNPNGTKKWDYIVREGIQNWILRSPSLAEDGTIYFINVVNDGINYISKLFALNPDGTLKWNYTGVKGSYISTTPSIAKDGTIYVGGGFSNETVRFGTLHAFNPDGTVKWNFTTKEFIDVDSVIGADGTIYFGDGGPKTFYALNPDGIKKWSMEIEALTSAVIGSDGTLYIGAYEVNVESWISKIYAIQGYGTSDLYVNTTVNNTNPRVGDTVQITYKVGNRGPATAIGTILEFLIPNGMQYLNASVDVGTFTYNASTRTITWNLGDVPVGDPYMYVFLKVLESGSFKIQPTLTTLSNDPNIASSIGYAVISAQETDTAIIPAKTIGMQKTGLPVAGFVLAVLAVLGGIFIPRRK